MNSKEKPLVTDTSILTMSTEYAAQFHDIFIDGKEHAKMTGDRMKMLMFTLPHMVRDLIAPEVTSTYTYVLVHTGTYIYIPEFVSYLSVCTRMY
jgi:hypothetical protein